MRPPALLALLALAACVEARELPPPRSAMTDIACRDEAEALPEARRLAGSFAPGGLGGMSEAEAERGFLVHRAYLECLARRGGAGGGAGVEPVRRR